ncbi:MAG TPA: hypothetical protein VLT45_07870, partial [Kofleriaceae bacterium]|nr:hypothetical protein [Kofleriaceae bacterium]
VDTPDAPATDRIAQLSDVLASVHNARKTENLGANELAKLAAAESNIVERLARLETARRAEAALLEARIVREHPTWRKLREALIGALKPHPEAARAVLEAFSLLEAS